MPIPTIQETAGVIAAPELRFTQQGKAVLSVRLAFNDSRYNEDTRQWENTNTFYVDGTAWEQTAERLADQIKKGDQVYVSGRLRTESWEKDGEKKSKPALTIRTMRKLEKSTPSQPAPSAWQSSPQGTDWGTPQNQPPAQPQQSAQPPADPWQGQQGSFQSSPGEAPF